MDNFISNFGVFMIILSILIVILCIYDVIDAIRYKDDFYDFDRYQLRLYRKSLTKDALKVINNISGD